MTTKRMVSRLLYLDFDFPFSEEQSALLEERMLHVSSMVGVQLERLAIYDTARGFHAVINSQWNDRREMIPAEIVALQLLLGSDPKREAFNLMRAHTLGDAPAFWRDRWNVLFSEKVKE